MSSLAITGVGELVTHDPSHVRRDGWAKVHDAAIVVDNGLVAWTGSAAAVPEADHEIDVQGRAVIPGFVDSHAHLVFSGDRAQEFEARMMGVPYTAGGITTTVAATRAAHDDELRANIIRLRREMLHSGITHAEIKSGYGLTVEDEERAVRLATTFTDDVTFLGAHVVPMEFRDNSQAYVELVCGPMLQACSPHAKWIDVFCDRGAFTTDDARQILSAGAAAGLGLRMHAGQLEYGEGIQLGAAMGAASVDHCTFATDEDLQALAASSTVATLVPGAEFSTRSPWPDARRFFAAGVAVALATDCNPGTSYTTSMPWVIAQAVQAMHFTPAQALHAATAGGATALRRRDIGHLAIGARADLVILDAPSALHLAYRPGVDLIGAVMQAGTTTYDRIGL